MTEFEIASLEQLQKLQPGMPGSEVLTMEFLGAGMGVNGVLVLASLYFMWNVRHPKTE